MLFAAACGDGIDERTLDGPAEVDPSLITDTTVPVALPSLDASSVPTSFIGTRAVYSGGHALVRLDSGTYVASGFDNFSDPEQPERGAIWSSDDLAVWHRTGADISGGDNQQTITALVTNGTRIIAAGSDLSRNSPNLTDYTRLVADAVVWLSDDEGTTFSAVPLQRDARVTGAAYLGRRLWAWGMQSGDIATGRLWWSDDDGDTWEGISPAASATPGAPLTPIGPVQELLLWDDSLIAVGMTTATDPDGEGVDLSPMDTDGLTVAWQPLDIGIWYADFSGQHWRSAAPNGLSGLPGGQSVVKAVVAGERLVLLGASVKSGDHSNDSFDQPMMSTIWICDKALQRCHTAVADKRAHDYFDGTMLSPDGLVYGVATSYNGFGTETFDVLFVLDPISETIERADLPNTIQQVETIFFDGEQLVLLGNGAYSNLMQVAKVQIDR